MKHQFTENLSHKYREQTPEILKLILIFQQLAQKARIIQSVKPPI